MQTVNPPKRDSFLSKHWAPFPPAIQRYHSLETIDEDISDGEKAVICGRVVAIEPGQISLQSGSVEPRLFSFKSKLEIQKGFAFTDVLVVGDLVEVLVQAIPGAPVLQIDGLTLLVPSKASNPFATSSFDHQRALQWQGFISQIRAFFVGQRFLELRTPSLVPSPGLEPFLDPFTTQFKMGQTEKNLYLPTSPEFHLKKALTRGFERIFELKECFRNGEISEHHQAEFLMLEWYRAYADSSALIKDLRELLKQLQQTFDPGSVLPLSVVTMASLWKQVLGFELTPDTTLEALEALAERLGIEHRQGENFDDVFALIFLEKIEPALKKKKEPMIVLHYPPSQAALARLTPDGWADRFELYWRGFEIANAFHELNDVEEQRLRFADDQNAKRALGKAVVPVDEEFMRALEYGMPPSAGIALGVDRLFMALLNLENIADSRMFPLTL